LKLALGAVHEYTNVSIETFDDECACIAKILSVQDKLIYAIVPTYLDDFVIPLIHNHRCVEKIYTYQPSEDQGPMYCIREYPKICGNGLSIDLLMNQITEDMNSVMKRPSRWSRSKTLLNQLCYQTKEPKTSLSIKDAFKVDLNNIHIFILFLDLSQPFRLSYSAINIKEFYYIEQCTQSINNSGLPDIFLIVSMSKFYDIRALAELDPVHAIYVVTDIKSNDQFETMSIHLKLSGIFGINEDLLDQLITDICFYRQIQRHLPTMNAFKLEPNILHKLSDHQIEFLCVQLFSGILPQLPMQLLTSSSNTQDNVRLLADIIQANVEIKNLFKDFNISALASSVTALKDISQQIESLVKTNNQFPDTVYRAQIVSKRDMEMLQQNSNNILALQTFIFASRSFQSIADICRRAVDKQLTVVLFELKLSKNMSVAALNLDTIVFSLGTIFRLVSTGVDPSGVWRPQLEPADGTMECIKNQLQIEIGGQLTWLTFGNYLTALKRVDAAKRYYDYILLVLPSDHPSFAFIYDNLTLVYLEITNDNKALELLKKASKFDTTSLPKPVKHTKLLVTNFFCPTSSSTDKAAIFKKIAENKYYEGDKKAALEYYRQVLHASIVSD
ncbi:unnamed protein product, partial [Rotaria magnacalcarata]